MKIYDYQIDGYAEIFRRYTSIRELLIQSPNPEEKFEALSQSEKQIYALTMFLKECANGGLSQYFFNASGDEWPILKKLLETIECSLTLKTLSSCLLLFPGQRPSTNAQERQQQILNLECQGCDFNKVVPYEIDKDLCLKALRHWGYDND